jgi:hypothetical protein
MAMQIIQWAAPRQSLCSATIEAFYKTMTATARASKPLASAILHVLIDYS